MLGNEAPELGDNVRVVTQFELAFHAVLERAQSLLFEPCRVGAGKPLIREVGESRSPPQPERIAEAHG
jgi:hypothetical protein